MLFVAKNIIAWQWVGWGQILHSPSPYLILIYLHVTLPISNGDDKLNLISVPDGFGYPCLIPVPVLNNFFLIKIRSFFATPREML